jgi:hypothetical protein
MWQFWRLITPWCLQPPAHAGSSLADFYTLKMELIYSSETSVHTRSTRRHIPEDGIFQTRTYASEMRRLLLEDNFCYGHGNAVKPAIVGACRNHMDHANKLGRITNCYSISGRTSNYQRLFFHLLDLTALNNFILLWSCCANFSHGHLGFLLCETFWTCQGSSLPKRPVGRSPPLSSRVSSLKEANGQHWSTSSVKKWNLTSFGPRENNELIIK